MLIHYSGLSKNPIPCPFRKPSNNAMNYGYRTLVLWLALITWLCPIWTDGPSCMTVILPLDWRSLWSVSFSSLTGLYCFASAS